MAPWTHLSRDELRVLDSTFWSAGESRHQLADRLGCSKSKANALIAGLIEQGLLVESGAQRSQGGRPAEMLRLSPALGVVLAIDVGATSLGVGVLSPDLGVLARHEEPADVRTQGPAELLARARKLLQGMLAQLGRTPAQVLGIGIGVPGPVNFAIGQLVNPPLMPSWDSFSIRDFLRDDFPRAPVWVDNDVNAMALGELWRLQRAWPNFLVIKVGTGIGCGIVCHGEVYRGATGSAGDVGHIGVAQDGPRCHCGNVGCVEALAAGPAIVRRATEAAESGESPALAELLRAKGRLEAVDVGEASRGGDAAANRIVQSAGMLIGQMLASVVNFFNPSHILLCGGIVHIGPLFLASVRQSVYHRSLPLSTRHLEVQLAGLGAHAGLIGAGALAMSELIKAGGEGPR